MSQSFDEVQVFGGIAERTGNLVDRATVRGRRNVCRSFTELGAKTRRMGDGYYYLAVGSWPADVTEINLNQTWACIA